MMGSMTRRRWIGIGVGTGWFGFLGVWMWRIGKAEQAARLDVTGNAEFLVTDSVRDATLPAGFEAVATPADFRSASGRYIAAANALFAFDEAGVMTEQWRCGFELPAARLTAVVEVGSVVWVATDGAGVVAIEGGKVRHVLPNWLAHRKVRALLAVESGSLLWGTAGGVVRFDGKALSRFQGSTERVDVTALAGKEEDLYVGTRTAGMWRFHAGQLTKFGEAEGLPDGEVQAVGVAGDVAVAGTPLGAALFRAGKFERKLAEGFFVRSLVVEGETLFAGTMEDGLVTVPLGATGRPEVTGQGEIRQVVSPTRVLTGTTLVSKGNPVVRAQAGLLTDGNVSALAMDGAGRLWVGYFDRGLDVLGTDGRVAHFENDRLFCVNRIVHGSGRTAVATANGLVYFDGTGKQKQVLTKADGLIATHVTDVLLGDDRAYVATPAGVTVFDKTGARSFNAFHGLVNNHVYSLAARGMDIFCGTLGGITRLHQGELRVSYNTANSGLGANWVSALAVAGTDLYAGTYGGGVYRLDGNNQWRGFGNDLPKNVVVNPGAMLATAQGIYAGTLEHGLLFYDLVNLRWQVIARGLPSINVTALALGNGYLYAGTDNGLVKIVETGLRV